MRNVVYTYAMSPKIRFQVMLDPAKLTALRAVETRTGATVGAQIRLGVDLWLRHYPDILRGVAHAHSTRKPSRGRAEGHRKRKGR